VNAWATIGARGRQEGQSDFTTNPTFLRLRWRCQVREGPSSAFPRSCFRPTSVHSASSSMRWGSSDPPFPDACPPPRHGVVERRPLRSNDVGSSSNGCDERLMSVAPLDLVADAQFPHDDLQDLAFPRRGAHVDGVDDDPVATSSSWSG